MEITSVLEKGKKGILDAWVRAVAETYPPETSQFLLNKKNRFANPVGSAITRGLDGLFDGLVSGAPAEDLAPHLDEIVRIRAVQKFSPSDSVSFIFALKGIVREALGHGSDKPSDAEIGMVEARIDALALLAFDTYMTCRETLFDIRVRELQENLDILSGTRWKKAAGSTTDAQNSEVLGRTNMKRGEDS